MALLCIVLKAVRITKNAKNMNTFEYAFMKLYYMVFLD